MNEPGPISVQAAKDAQNANVLAVREIGGNNRGLSVETYLHSVDCDPGEPWCAAFVFYRLRQAGRALNTYLPRTFNPRGYTPTWKNWAVDNDLWIPVGTAKNAPIHLLRVGDAALFYFASMNRIGHIGIVTAVHDWGVETVEGNTGPDAGQSVERNGDGVFRKKRTWAQLGAKGGFARLPF